MVLLCATLYSRAAVEFPAATMSTISPTDFDSVEIQQQYNDINNRWDIAAETEWDNENSSARLFERSRIKALAGQFHLLIFLPVFCEDFYAQVWFLALFIWLHACIISWCSTGCIMWLCPVGGGIRQNVITISFEPS